MFKIFYFLILATSLFSSNISLEWLKEKPKGNARDFYIWRYLLQDINKSVAKEAYSLRASENQAIKKAFKRFDDEPLKLDSNITITIPSKPKPTFEEQVANPKNIILFVTDLNKTNAQLALLDFNKTDISFNESFYLFINALRYDEKQKARYFLDLAKKKAIQKTEVDKASFWEYYAFDDNASLVKLSNSHNANFYSVYATQKLKSAPLNIVYDLNISESNQTELNVNDPFLCIQCIGRNAKTNKSEFDYYKNIFSSSSKYKTQLTYLLNIANEYKVNYFLTPFEQYLQNLSLERKVLIYSIGRQESRFLPNVISGSFAMGAMQVMPFVSADIAKQLKEPYDIEKQFELPTNIKYANKVVDMIENDFKHPLFVAYSYNGGAGMLKRTLKKGYFKLGRYEPFLSLELFPVGESREYGKQVLANYFIYSNYLGKKITFDELVDSIGCF